MELTFSTAQNGLYVANQRLQVNANNLSNLTTRGFKAQLAQQGDIYVDGTRLMGIGDDLSIGAPEQTGQSTDLYIEGEGLFQVAQDGEPAYTRLGDFRVDRDGNLVTPSGHMVEPNITVPEDSVDIEVLADGTVFSIDGNREYQEIGQLELVRFQNPEGLISLGNNLYAQGPDSGNPLTGVPSEEGYGAILQRYLEGSNVDPAQEITQQIVNQRFYQMNLRVFQTNDALVGRAIDLFS